VVGKDIAQNIRNTHELVINVVNEEIAAPMNVCAIDFPPGVNELEKAGLTTAKSSVVKVPRIAEAPAAMECRELTTLEVGRSRVILGTVVDILSEMNSWI
jgi:flavin reductase (DIM6/NTAB) family NADH-FMN oxidoreductase RutF